MSGKMNNEEKSLSNLFELQRKNQVKLMLKGAYDGFASGITHIPIDSPKLCSYHIQQLVSEIGEVLEADKRWKNFRNSRYDPELKLDEIADCFIVLMNVAMFSGFEANQLYEAIKQKIEVVSKRIVEEA